MNELGDGILTGGGVNGMGTLCGDTAGDEAGAAGDTTGDLLGIVGIVRGPPICESIELPPTERSFLGTGGGASR